MNQSRLYVGNILFSTTEDQLRDLFRPREVKHARVCTDRESGRPRGFGFVELATPADAADAVKSLDGSTWGGRKIVVSLAKPKPASGRDTERRAQ